MCRSNRRAYLSFMLNFGQALIPIPNPIRLIQHEVAPLQSAHVSKKSKFISIQNIIFLSFRQASLELLTSLGFVAIVGDQLTPVGILVSISTSPHIFAIADRLRLSRSIVLAGDNKSRICPRDSGLSLLLLKFGLGGAEADN